MGKEKPIEDDAPGRHIAEYLRALRLAAGSPSYRLLGPLVHVTQNALSAHASGARVIQWASMELYIAAVQVHAAELGIDLVTDMRPHAERFGVNPDDEILVQARTVYERNVAMTVLNRSVISLIEAQRASLVAGMTEERAAVPGPPAPAAVESAKNLAELVRALADLVVDLGWSPGPGGVQPEATPPYLLQREVADVFAGRAVLDEVVFTGVLHASGAGIFEEHIFYPHHPVWTVAWQRATAATDDLTTLQVDETAGVSVPALQPPTWRLRVGAAARRVVALFRVPSQRTADHDVKDPAHPDR